MKILLVITGLFPGGAEKIVLELVRNLLRKGHEVVVVSLQAAPRGGDRAIPEELEKLHVRTYYLNLSGHHPFRIFRLVSVIRHERPDVVHSHLMHANLAARLARLLTVFPLVNTLHIAERRNRRQERWLFRLDRLTCFLADAYTAVSAAAAHFHEQRCGFPPNRIVVVWNGSDPVIAHSPETLTELRRTWGLADTGKLIGSIGRLDPQKGYDLLLRTLPSLRPLIPPGERWGVLLIGDGPERERLRRQAEELEKRLPEIKIVLPGYRADAARILPMLDLFVMPSRYEGFGLALTEALSFGLPCLCSPADSLPELCALAPENTLLMDFEGRENEWTETYRKALTLSRGPGKILWTTDRMTEEYLRIYRSVAKD